MEQMAIELKSLLGIWVTLDDLEERQDLGTQKIETSGVNGRRGDGKERTCSTRHNRTKEKQ